MAQSIFDYETKAFLSILAISLIGMALVVSQQPLPSTAFFTGPVFKTPATNTYLLKSIDIGESIGEDIPMLTKNELKGLEDGSVHTNAGKTDYSQYLILKKTGTNGFDGGSVIFGRDQSQKTGNYIFFEEDERMFEYAIIFSQGLASKMQNNRLVDVENKYLTILGSSFVIVQTDIDAEQKRVKLRLMGSEGIIDFEDRNYADTEYERGARVNSKLVDAEVRIMGTVANDKFFISEIRYAPLASTRTSGDIYISPRQGLRGRLKDASALLVNGLEFIYGGLTSGTAAVQNVGGGEFVVFAPKGNDQYDLTFTNDLGVQYDIPLVAVSGSTFKYGSSKKDLVYTEGNDNTDYNIDRGDYFVVNNKNDLHGVTNVLEYNGIRYDDATVDFLDIGTRQEKSIPFDKSTGQGYLVVSGNTYTFYVSSTGEHPIVIDQNGDGAIDGGEAKIVLRSGGRLDLGSGNIIGGNSITMTLTTQKRLFAEPTTDEVIDIVITRDGSTLDVNVPPQKEVTLYRSKERTDKGMSDFGVYFLKDKRNRDSGQLVIEYPRAGVFNIPSTAQGQAALAITLEREKYLRKQE